MCTRFSGTCWLVGRRSFRSSLGVSDYIADDRGGSDEATIGRCLYEKISSKAIYLQRKPEQYEQREHRPRPH